MYGFFTDAMMDDEEHFPGKIRLPQNNKQGQI